MMRNTQTSVTPLGRLWLLALLLCTGVLSTGCQTATPAEQIAIDNERKAWSAQYSWVVIRQEQNPSFAESATRWAGNTMASGFGDVVASADEDFTSQLDLASGSQLPPGGVGGLLESIRPKVAAAIAAEAAHLQGNGVGLILLGDLTGPDGQPLATSSQGVVEIERFMGDLLRSQGLSERWYYLSMTPQQAEAQNQQAGAGGSNAVQGGGRTYVYNSENLLVLNLAISATPNPTNHRVDYNGVGSIATPSTRTSSGIEGARVQYFYQPFEGAWITGVDEMARRQNDPKE